MKTVKIVLITILCGLIIFLFGILDMGIRNKTPFSINRGGGILAKYELVQEQEFEPADIAELRVKYEMSSNDVYIYEGTGEKIVVREYANYDMEDESSVIQKEGTTLSIKAKREFHFIYIGGSRHAYTEIYLPAGFRADVDIVTSSGDIVSERDFTGSDNFSVSSTSGEIRFQKVEAGDIRAGSTSGGIWFGQMSGNISVATTSGDVWSGQMSGNISVATTSGEILLKEAEGSVSASTTSGDVDISGGAGNRQISSTSGEIRLSNVSGRFDLSTTSGDIYLENGEGFGEANTISGEVSIRLNALQGSLDIGTTSGDVFLGIPSREAFTFDFDSTSGECGTFFDEVLSFNKKGTSASGVYGNGAEMEIAVSTTSGDVRISESTGR